MNDQARLELKNLFDQEGQDLYKDPQRLKGKLQDHCARFEPERLTLIYALDQGVPADLMKERLAGAPIRSSIAAIARRLERIMDAQKARWAVESWAFALGLIDQASLQQQSGPIGRGKKPVQEKQEDSNKDEKRTKSPEPEPTNWAYRLVAVSLGVVATGICALIVMHSLAGYHPNSSACYQALQSATSASDLPEECRLPIGEWIIAVFIFAGGLRAAAKVWARE